MVELDVPPIVSAGGYHARDLILTEDKFKWMWNQLINHRALYAQMGYITPDAFVRLVTSPGRIFYEITREDGTIVGSIYIGNVDSVEDVDVHIFFFDRMLTDKVLVCRALGQHVFDTLGYHRLNCVVPKIYGATARFIQRVGFKLEGTKREYAHIQGRWVDLLTFGLLRSDLENLT